MKLMRWLPPNVAFFDILYPVRGPRLHLSYFLLQRKKVCELRKIQIPRFGSSFLWAFDVGVMHKASPAICMFLSRWKASYPRYNFIPSPWWIWQSKASIPQRSWSSARATEPVASVWAVDDGVFCPTLRTGKLCNDGERRWKSSECRRRTFFGLGGR